MTPDASENNPSPVTRSKRKAELPRWVTVSVFTLFGLGLLLVWYFGTRPPDGIRLDTIKADIQETLPAGTSRERVDAWIAGHGFTNIGDTTDAGGRVNGMKVTVPNSTWFDEADIVILFTFDRDWKLEQVSPSRLFRR